MGGLVISVRSVPRFTKDLDFAVAVANDSEAEDVVHRLRGVAISPSRSLSRITWSASQASGWDVPPPM